MCVLMSLLLVLPLRAAHVAVLEKDDVIVHYGVASTRGAEVVVGRYSTIRDEAEDRLGLRLKGQTSIVLMNESSAFREYVGNDLLVAVALPHKNRVVIDYAHVMKRPFSLEAVLKHELCHLILHTNIMRGSLPKWLDEGTALWASEGISEVIMMNAQDSLDEAVLAGTTIPLRFLSDSFPEPGEQLTLAYEQSKSFVEYMIDQYGEDRFRLFLSNLKNGSSIEDALVQNFDYTLASLERQWLGYLKEKVTWFVYLSKYMYEFLFIAGALVTVIGFLRYLARRRAFPDVETEENHLPY